MSTLQNLDVHGTFGARQVSLPNPFPINSLVIQNNGGRGLNGVGRSDKSDRYRFDPKQKSRGENARPPFVEALFISEYPSAASKTGGGRWVSSS